MQETVYPTLAASYDYFYRTGEIPPRTGNRQSGLNSAPYNVFATADGHVAIHVVTEAHFQNLLKAMGREDLADDPRFATNAAGVAHIDETDALVESLDAHPRQDRSVRTHQGLPHPVRAGAHRAGGHERPAHHERGMLTRIDHPETGEIVVPTTPLRLHGTPRKSEPARAQPSASTMPRSTVAGSACRQPRSRSSNTAASSKPALPGFPSGRHPVRSTRSYEKNRRRVAKLTES